jgi:ribosome-associated heat shock protein Hsp15
MRIDKWLWAVRVYKTRADAADACRTSRVSVGGAWAKASREVQTGDVVAVRKGPVTFTFRVLEPIGNRVGAKDVARFAENITPQEEMDKLLAPRETVFITRDRGTGRPTKKERRDIEGLIEGWEFEE